jgi:hypothetical protein
MLGDIVLDNILNVEIIAGTLNSPDDILFDEASFVIELTPYSETISIIIG